MDDEMLDNSRPGIGRLHYFLARIILIVVTVFAVFQFGPGTRIFSVVSLAVMVAGVVLDVMRLRNIGLSDWWMFLRFIPWLGLPMSIALQTVQSGWCDSKRLDRSGWAILGVHAALIVLILYLVNRGPDILFLPF